MKSREKYSIFLIGKELNDYYTKLKDADLDIKYFEKVDGFIKYLKREYICLEEIVIFVYAENNKKCTEIIDKLNKFFEYFFIVVPSICVIKTFKNISDFSSIAKEFDYLIDLTTTHSEIKAVSNFVYLKKKEELERRKYELINQAVVLDLYEEFVKSGKTDIPVFYFGIDNNGILKTIDDRILKILGFSKDEIIGEHFSELIANEELDKVLRAFKERRTGERGSKGIILKLRRKDGGYSEFVVDSQGVHIPTVREKPTKEPKRLYIGTFGKVRMAESSGKGKINIDFFNVTNEPIFLYSMEDHKLLLNRGLERFLGYRSEEIIDKDPSFFEKKEYSYFSKALEDIKTKGHAKYSTTILKKSGEPVECDISIEQIEFEGKHYLVGIYRDITEIIDFINKADNLIRLTSLMVNSKNREELIKMASQEIINILDVLYLGVALWDDKKGDFSKVYFSDKNIGQFGDESIKQKYDNYFELMKKSLSENVVKYIELNREISISIEEPGEKAKAGEFISIPLGVNEKKLGCMFVITNYFRFYTLRDIRMMELSGHVLSSGIYRYELENKLKRSLETLEKRVKERTKELEEFVYTVSHDLKSPLYAAKSFAEIIEEQLADQFESDEDSYILRRIGENIETAIRMIDDLLNLSRVGTAKMQIVQINLKDIIDEYLLQFKAVDKSDLKLKINLNEDAAPIYADKGRILQLFNNLFDNSIKYRKSDSVLVNVTAKRLNGVVRIIVEDNGIGIENEEIDKIFKVFYRGKAALDRKVEGSGCGLSIVKKIVEMHNGKIEVESKPSEGTRFIIELPVNGE